MKRRGIVDLPVVARSAGTGITACLFDRETVEIPHSRREPPVVILASLLPR